MISQAEANFFGTTNFIFCNKHSQPIMQAVQSKGIYIFGLLSSSRYMTWIRVFFQFASLKTDIYNQNSDHFTSELESVVG